MCWSFKASASLATLGFAATSYAVARHEPPTQWVPLVINRGNQP